MSFPPDRYVLGLEEIDQTQVAVVGGKGAQLGELSRIEGIHVPAGFCVTTDAFRRVMAYAPAIDDRLDRLSRLNPDDREAVRTLSTEIRRTLEGIAIPDDLAAAITRALARLGEQTGYAVRSSATAEDLPTASFAGHGDRRSQIVRDGDTFEGPADLRAQRADRLPVVRVQRDSRSSRSSIAGAHAMTRRKASVVTQKPAGTSMPSIRESSPAAHPYPTTAPCVLSIS